MEQKKIVADVRLMGAMIEETLSRGDSVRLIVTGNSMFPLLHNRKDTVLLAPAKTVKKYDITFHKRQDGRYILHRVVGINRDGTYNIAGDNELKPEPPVLREQILGVVTEFTRWSKTCRPKGFRYWLYVRIWCLLMPWRWKIINFRFRKYLKRLGEQSNEKSESN